MAACILLIFDRIIATFYISLFIWTFAWPFNATNDNANKQVTIFLFRDKWAWETEKETEQLPFNKNQLLGVDNWGSHLVAIIYLYLLCVFYSVDEVSYLYFMKNTGSITSTQNIEILQQRYWYHLRIRMQLCWIDETANISWLVKIFLTMSSLPAAWDCFET